MSHVAMEQHLCPVCGAVFDTGAVLFDSRLRDSFKDRHAVSGYEMCADCKARTEEGFVALVASRCAATKVEDADPTGEMVWVRRSAWSRIFNIPAPEGGLAYCQPEVIAALKAIPQEGGDDGTT